jgi:hypothetical protein
MSKPRVGFQSLLLTRGPQRHYQPVERDMRTPANRLAALWEYAEEMRQRPENCGLRHREAGLKGWIRRRQKDGA